MSKTLYIILDFIIFFSVWTVVVAICEKYKDVLPVSIIMVSGVAVCFIAGKVSDYLLKD